jgi:hypothetical protein
MPEAHQNRIGATNFSLPRFGCPCCLQRFEVMPMAWRAGNLSPQQAETGTQRPHHRGPAGASAADAAKKKSLSELHVEKRSETSQTRSVLGFKVITKNPATARLCGWRNT